MKQSSVNLINQIDDKDTELLEKILLFLTANIPAKQQKHKRTLTPEQKRRMALVKELSGAFAACQTDNWKNDKEEYLLEKYEKQNESVY